MAAPTPIPWCCSSPMSRHFSIKVGFLGVLWSSGPCSTSFAPADDALWGSCPSLFRWGPCDWYPAIRSDCQWGDFLGHGQRCADSRSHFLGDHLSYGGSLSPHGCVLTTPPTTSPCALPGYDPTANGPCAVPLSVKKAAVCFIVPYRRAPCWGWAGCGIYTLNATKLFWSRSGIMHVAIAWDHKPLLLLATALLPNRTTESFEREAGPPYDKQRIQMGLRSGNTILISVSGVELATSKVYWLLLPLTCILTSRGKDSISFGSTSRQFALTLLGCLSSWLVPTAVLSWTDALTSLTVKCTTCREVNMISGILWCSRIFIILEIPRVPRNWRSFSACPVKGWGCAVGSSVLTGCIPMDRASARSSLLQLLNCCGLQLELRLFVVKMRHKSHYMLPCCHFSALRTDMSWLLWALLC